MNIITSYGTLLVKSQMNSRYFIIISKKGWIKEYLVKNNYFVIEQGNSILIEGLIIENMWQQMFINLSSIYDKLYKHVKFSIKTWLRNIKNIQIKFEIIYRSTQSIIDFGIFTKKLWLFLFGS